MESQALKLIFFIKQYLLFFIFIASAFGLGRMVLYSFHFPNELTSPPFTLLSITTGIGVMIVALFVLGILGLLKPLNAYLLIGFGLFITSISIWSRCKHFVFLSTAKSQVAIHFRKYWFFYGLYTYFFFRYMIRPLELPMHWDELMYHLPIAKAWAESGHLTVETWLRYPLFPYNFNLLYAASLLIADDVFTHILHMLAGFLTVGLLVTMGKRWFDLRVGLLASCILLISIKSQIGTSNVDMGVMLFLTFGLAALALSYEHRNLHYLYLSGFLVALSVGTKYQALFYLPVYAILVLLFERRLKVLTILAFILFVFGGYWYFRNWIISGDPIHPIGGRWFGYWLWNESDIQLQFVDFVNRKNLPGPALMIGFFALLYFRNLSAMLKSLYLAAACSFLVWLLASGYLRYFIPAMPLLAMLSGFTLVRTFDLVKNIKVIRYFRSSAAKRILTIVGITIVLAAIVSAIGSSEKSWRRIIVGPESREAFLEKNLSSFDILRDNALDEHVWPIYQFGFEDEIYYAPVPVIGDHFGPARYRSIIQIAGNAEALAIHLKDLGAGGIVINRARAPFKNVHFDFDDKYFKLISKTDRAELYFLRNK